MGCRLRRCGLLGKGGGGRCGRRLRRPWWRVRFLGKEKGGCGCAKYQSCPPRMMLDEPSCRASSLISSADFLSVYSSTASGAS